MAKSIMGLRWPNGFPAHPLSEEDAPTSSQRLMERARWHRRVGNGELVQHVPDMWQVQGPHCECPVRAGLSQGDLHPIAGCSPGLLVQQVVDILFAHDRKVPSEVRGVLVAYDLPLLEARDILKWLEITFEFIVHFGRADVHAPYSQ